jgi:hypothetical protein
VTDSGDPTRASALRPLRLLLTAMDEDIARFYAERASSVSGRGSAKH